MRPDVIVVGSGLTGAVVARVLTDNGYDVLVIEKRHHVGGNVHDYRHESGARIHTYGPHYFRTSSLKIWDFVSRFAKFYKYEAEVLSDVGDGSLAVWPPNADVLERFGLTDWIPNSRRRPENFEEACLDGMPAVLYELFVKEYNEKQWGRKASDLLPKLFKRFDVRAGSERRLTPNATWQGIPVVGYCNLMTEMLRGIRVECGVDYLDNVDKFLAKMCIVYTGPIDHFFGCDLGRLEYRGQLRKHTWMPKTDKHQEVGQVNNPLHAGGEHIRTIEWKHIMNYECRTSVIGTVTTTETPFAPTESSDFEYPVPDNANADLYARYRRRANTLGRVIIAGRLGEYKYLDMDQAIGRAMKTAETLISHCEG